MGISVTYLWMAFGVLLLLAEALGVPGSGLLFAGLGAIVTGALVSLGFLAEGASVHQLIVFGLSSAIFAVALWKPLKRFRLGKKQGFVAGDVVGDTAYVGSGGLTRQGGEVTWSGTIMKARLSPHSGTEKLEGGAAVEIVEVQGTTLIVKPKG